MKNKLVAAGLAFFLGSFGIHKFYLKDTGSGIFYLILSILGIRLFAMPVSGILGLIDGIMLLSMSDEVFDKKYNSGEAFKRRDRRRYTQKSYPNQERRRESRRTYQPKGAPRAEAPVRKRKKVVRDNPFKRSGVKKYKDFDLEEAIIDFKKGLELEPEDISLHFNLACAYSLTEKPKNAYHHLSKAVANGFKDYEKIKTHDDLAFLRIHKEFHEFQENGYKIIKSIPVQDIQENNEEQAQANPRPVNEDNALNDDILLSQLNKLDELRKKGLISDKEFQTEKRKLLRD